MKRREVQRHVGAELGGDPFRERVDFLLRVIVAGDQERRDLEPDVGLALQVHERLEDGPEMAPRELPIELVGERLEIDVRRVHVRVELAAGLCAHVARRHGDSANASSMTSLRYVDRVLHEDDRIVVSEGDTAAAELASGTRHSVGRCRIGQRIRIARFTDIPILAKLAGKKAAGRAEREHGCARQKMKQRLLLDRIDAKAARTPIGREHELAAQVAAHEAKASLPLVHAAIARADVALHATVFGLVPIPRGPRFVGADR
jgi:hypothetical protein